ncbi:hypothetical protein ACHWQZ_G010220 [Mnemiopsis leidyi]
MSLRHSLIKVGRPLCSAFTSQIASYTSKPPEIPSKAVFVGNRSSEAPPLVPSRNPNIALDEGCWLCQNNLQDFDYRDVLVLDQFIRDKEMKTAEELGVCSKMQRKLKSSIRKAIKHGLLPEDILSEAEYWSLGPERSKPVFHDTEKEYGIQFADLYPNEHKYRHYRLGPIIHRINKHPVSDNPVCLGWHNFRKGEKSYRRNKWKKNLRERENIK